MSRRSVGLIAFVLLLGCALPMHATTNCTYNFQSGTGNSFLHFCVTVNGNIPTITTPDGDTQLASAGEGYGICGTKSPTRYEDYGTSDTGNWQGPKLLSKSGTSVKIARTTSDGHWTLTQTISKVAKTSSITVVMALTNNQSTSDGAFLVRYTDPTVPQDQTEALYVATINAVSAIGIEVKTDDGDAFLPGLQLQNVGTPGFGFWQGYVQDVPTGPNACAYSSRALSPGESIAPIFSTSMEVAYVDVLPAGGTKTVTLSYHGF